MNFPRDLDQQRQIMYAEQVKTNELLTQLIQILAPSKIKTEIKEDPYKNMTRPVLMKTLSQLEDKPQGFQTWKNEKMKEHLRGLG